ncbi:MAG: hypothetical protein RQ745_06415 [Longimicrobiales bacterium]|nr:hypothetical protein [Longimicrobiales bacterium]
MFRKRRALAGLLAALAMLASLGEAVWASTCAPPTASAAFGSAAFTAPVPGEAVPPGHDHGADEGARGEMPCCDTPARGDSSPDTSCPFDSPLASQTCAGLSALASTGNDLPDAVANRDFILSSAFELAHLTAAYTPFHPPRG